MANPTVEDALAILGVMEEFGLADDVELRETYSGRAMYGEKVPAFVGDGVAHDVPLAIGVMIGRGELDDEVAVNWFMRSDSMGRTATVVY